MAATSSSTSESGQEGVEQGLRLGLGVLDELVEEGPLVGGADRRGGPLRVRALRVAGEGVDEVGDVLPLEDLLRREVRGGGPYLPVDDGQRVADARQVLAPAGDEGEVEGVSGEASGPADALDVGGDGAGQRGEHHGGQVADVDAHLEGGRGDKHVRRLGVGVSALESRLVAEAGLVVQEAGVLARDDAPHVRRRVQVPVEVVLARRPVHPSRAVGQHAGGAVELVDRLPRAGHLVTADLAHEQVLPRREGVEVDGVDDDGVRGDRVDGRAAVRAVGAEHVSLGEGVEELLGDEAGIAGLYAEGACGPAAVPGLRGGDGVEELVLAVLRGSDPGEGGGAAPLGEGGHALVLGPSAPDPVAGAVGPEVPLEPLVVETAALAHALEDSADPCEQGGVVEPGEVSVEGVLPGGLLDDLPRDADQLGRRAGLDVDGDGARGLEGAPDSGQETHLEARVEQQAPSHAGADRGRDGAQGLRLPEGAELLVLDEGGRQEAVAGEDVVAGVADRLVDELFKGLGSLAEGPAEDGAQGEAVRARLDEAGPVGGVLDGVGEDEGLLLRRVELGVAEEGRQRHGQERGDRRAEEADAAVLLAGGADVVAGERVGVGPDVGEDGQDVTLSQGRVVVGRGRVQEDALAGVEPSEPFERPGLGAGGVLAEHSGVGLARRVEERAEATPFGGVVRADLGVRDGERRALGGELDSPSRAAAVAAVDRRERRCHVLAGGEVDAVVGPAVGGAGLGGAVDAGELADPQVQGDRERLEPEAGAHVGESREQVREDDAAGLPAADPGEERGEELVLVDGVDSPLDEAVDQGMGAHEVQGVEAGGETRACGQVPERLEHPCGHVLDVAHMREGRGQLTDLCVPERRRGEARGPAPLDGVGGPLLEAEAGLGDHHRLVERLAEDGAGEVDHGAGVALVAEGGGGRHGGDPAEGALPVGVVQGRCPGLEGEPESAQQHGHVGALGAVVGVELVEDEVLQGGCAQLPDVRVLVA